MLKNYYVSSAFGVSNHTFPYVSKFAHRGFNICRILQVQKSYHVAQTNTTQIYENKKLNLF
jgi:hypothetical protein